MTDSILFVEEVQKIFKCPNSNCLKYMIDPVTVKCGHSFCKKCAMQIDKCPIDNYKIDKKNYFPNLVLSSQIQEMKVFCGNGTVQNPTNRQLERDATGCPTTIELKNKELHEVQCPYRVVNCPYNSMKCKDKFRFKDTEEHRQKCKYSNNKNAFIFAPKDTMNTELNQQTLRTPKTELDIQQIADNLTLRIKRLEAQMGGSLNRMENMFYEIHSGINALLSHLNIDPEEMKNAKDLPRNHNTTKRNSNKLPEENKNLFHQLNSLSMKEIANISGVMSSSGGNSNIYKSSHWICPFSFLNAGILMGHRKMITSLIQFENYIITSSQDQTVRIWNISSLLKGEFGKPLTNGGCLAVLTGHNFPISCLAMSRSSREIVSVDSESNLKVWDLTSSSLVREKEHLHEQITTSIAVSKSVIFTASNSEIKMWHLKSLEQIGFVNHSINHFVRCLVIGEPQEKYLYSSGHNQVLVWQIKYVKDDESNTQGSVDLDLIKSIPHSYYSVNSMVVSACYIIIGTYNKNIQIFNNSSGEHLFSLAGHVAQVNGLCLTSSESHLVSVSADGCINIWELDRRTLIQSINVGSGYCGQAVIVIGDVLFICGSDAEIKIYRYDRMFS